MHVKRSLSKNGWTDFEKKEKRTAPQCWPQPPELLSLVKIWDSSVGGVLLPAHIVIQGCDWDEWVVHNETEKCRDERVRVTVPGTVERS